MAKPKSPLLSLGARGTIGDSLTFQKRNQATMARSKPTPAYRYTLPQAYQRWLYQDYAYLWTQQSEATKRQYAVSGSRFHLTGFQYWMKYQLANLPDITGMWHLDKISNGSVIDFSKNLNHGTVFGASLIKGVIDKALLFDGTDDYVDCGSNDSLKNINDFTWDCWINWSSSGYRTICYQRGLRPNLTTWETIFQIGMPNENKLSLYLRAGWRNSNVNIPSGWSHIAVTFNDTTNDLIFYINGTAVATISVAAAPEIDTLTQTRLGVQSSVNYFNGLLDEVRIYNRALDATEIKRHSERRYPL